MKDYLPLIHRIVVSLFLLIYLIKTALLLLNKNDALKSFTKLVKVPEMIISILFLMTGIWLMVYLDNFSPLLLIKISVVLLSIPVAIVGFKKKNKALAVLSFIMILSGYGMAEIAKKHKSGDTSIKLTEQSSGKDIFNSKCSGCHGKNAINPKPGYPNISESKISSDSIFKVIYSGRNGIMYAYKDSLSENQIKNVVSFIDTVRKK